jgi:hypothetical protein
MISSGFESGYPQWLNAVRLAGELKIAEAAPSLAKWIVVDQFGEITASMVQRLDIDPAGKALSQIGDPAIPTLIVILAYGTVRQCRVAYLALNLIGSVNAKALLRSRRVQETDPDLLGLVDMLNR